MALTVGSRLGHYDVTALIGEGGMGQVYQATDTKLNRQVALKILPEAFATDPDRLARFQREAQVLASLNHPNIAAIHGLEDSEGTKALVLELVEGPTLADRITTGSRRSFTRRRKSPNWIRNELVHPSLAITSAPSRGPRRMWPAPTVRCSRRSGRPGAARG